LLLRILLNEQIDDISDRFLVFPRSTNHRPA
jgi:hypothetical protein